jgi:hypothetical protein
MVLLLLQVRAAAEAVELKRQEVMTSSKASQGSKQLLKQLQQRRFKQVRRSALCCAGSSTVRVAGTPRPDHGCAQVWWCSSSSSVTGQHIAGMTL